MTPQNELLPLIIVLTAIVAGLVVKEVRLHHRHVAGQGAIYMQPGRSPLIGVNTTAKRWSVALNGSLSGSPK